MKSSKITLEGREYLKVELEEIVQKDQSFYVAKIQASDFLKLYTVRPAEYDLQKNVVLAESFPDDAEYYQHIISQNSESLKNKDFQRDANRERVLSIGKFLDNEEYAFFPNTIIANCEIVNDYKDFDINENSSDSAYFNSNVPEYLSFFQRRDDLIILYIPYVVNSILVIDGQHRLKGLEQATPPLQENYQLLIAFIIGYDRSVIAKQFYTINYEQKAVNKSLLYQLTGEFTTEVSELSFMHNTVKLLNELSDSPFYGRIKMLGKVPESLPNEEKVLMSISQAFLIDAMIRLISPSARNTNYPPIFLKYFLDQSSQIFIIRTVARFFNAVSLLKPDWREPENSIVSKGMGVGALIKILNIIFPIIFKDRMNSNWDAINEVNTEVFSHYLSGLENVDFSNKGKFGGAGSAGSISKIKDEILSNLLNIGYTGNEANFQKTYQTNYLTNFESRL